MSIKAKDFLKPLSVQNQNLDKNKFNDVLGNMGLDNPEEDKEVTEEEHTLIYFSQKQKEKIKRRRQKIFKTNIRRGRPFKLF